MDYGQGKISKSLENIGLNQQAIEYYRIQMKEPKHELTAVSLRLIEKYLEQGLGLQPQFSSIAYGIMYRGQINIKLNLKVTLFDTHVSVHVSSSQGIYSSKNTNVFTFNEFLQALTNEPE